MRCLFCCKCQPSEANFRGEHFQEAGIQSRLLLNGLHKVFPRYESDYGSLVKDRGQRVRLIPDNSRQSEQGTGTSLTAHDRLSSVRFHEKGSLTTLQKIQAGGCLALIEQRALFGASNWL